ncbi:MAG: hypothetical protein ACI87E_001891 [Mariniblastus sp.]|jgi:uncharacterized protein (DUF1800 family)
MNQPTVNRPNSDPQTAWLPYEPTSENPWSHRLAAHLFRRCTFGSSIGEIVAAEKAGHSQTLALIFQEVDDVAMEAEMATAGRLVTGGTDSNQLAAWWLLRMLKTPSPFLENMTLFWHGHFATGADKVLDARAMLRQNQLLRKHALGRFEPMLKTISRDAAMLIYLDSEENRKTRPNENYARELMELFCLGPGNYTETDIKEIARCFTGWEVRKGRFAFNEHQHDKNSKAFLGSKGDFDGDDAIEIVLQQPAAAMFLAKKLIRYFVFDDEPISDEFASPIANRMRETGFDIRATVKTIVSSRVFFSPRAIGRKIKSPVELAIGFLRFFEASTNCGRLGQQLESLGQLPLYPPNVKGWAGGRSWINASTILARANLITDILSNGKTKFKHGNLNDWAKQYSEAGVDQSVDWIETYLLATPLAAQTRDDFTSLVKQSGSDPKRVLGWLAALPEFQLN